MAAGRHPFGLSRALPALALLALAGCAHPSVPPPGTGRLRLEPARFADLPGWRRDVLADAVPALAKSCPPLLRSKAAAGWRGACAAISRLKPGDRQAARHFFEHWFRPYLVTANGSATGLFTAYYEPEIKGARHRHGPYTVPLLARPSDLVTVDPARFHKGFDHRRLVGRVEDGRLVPYPTRARIEAGALGRRARPLFWLEDPVAAAILQIQGSGLIALPDGTVRQVGVAATNGREFVGPGRILAERGIHVAPDMPAIRDWLRAHPRQAKSVLDANPRYVFYRLMPHKGPVGTEGVVLTPGRSLAVDPRYIALGTPLWLDTTAPGGKPIRRLVVAQDTGGAIKGPVRGDLFWGIGEAAFSQAGRMKAPGRYWLLLPKR